MPRRIGIIQQPGFFDQILQRLGVNRPGEPFTLDGDVIPVVLVESGVEFVSSPTPAYRVADIFTAGEQIAPGAGAVLADTGQLAAGSYAIQIAGASDEGNFLQIQWRNAANTGNLATWEYSVNLGTNVTVIFRANVLNNNERFRVINRTAGGVGSVYQAAILARI